VVLLQTVKASLVEELRSMSVFKSRLEVQLAAAIAGRTKDARDIARLRDERNSAVSEYNLVMSERDSVLRESEQLRSTISALELKVEAAEQGRKAATEEAERARVEFEASQLQAQALASSLSMDSSYLKEIDHLRRELDKTQAELLGNKTCSRDLFVIMCKNGNGFSGLSVTDVTVSLFTLVLSVALQNNSLFGSVLILVAIGYGRLL